MNAYFKYGLFDSFPGQITIRIMYDSLSEEIQLCWNVDSFKPFERH